MATSEWNARVAAPVTRALSASAGFAPSGRGVAADNGRAIRWRAMWCAKLYDVATGKLRAPRPGDHLSGG
jgi:hypothetical protein